MGKYTCQRPIHPGELLKEEIESRGLPQTRLAAQTGISYKILNDILNCRRPLTTSTAMLFEAALGISAGLLMRMQLDYNMQQATRDTSFMERLAPEVRGHAVTLDVKEVSRPAPLPAGEGRDACFPACRSTKETDV